jgi:hypothetical protein
MEERLKMEITPRLLKLALWSAVAAAMVAGGRVCEANDYIGPDGGLWSDPNNWSAGIPNSLTADVTIANPYGPSAVLDISPMIRSLTVGTGEGLSIADQMTLTMAGPGNGSATIANSGTVALGASSLGNEFGIS